MKLTNNYSYLCIKMLIIFLKDILIYGKVCAGEALCFLSDEVIMNCEILKKKIKQRLQLDKMTCFLTLLNLIEKFQLT